MFLNQISIFKFIKLCKIQHKIINTSLKRKIFTIGTLMTYKSSKKICIFMSMYLTLKITNFVLNTGTNNKLNIQYTTYSLSEKN